MAKRKIAKVINQYTSREGFSEWVTGVCACCGAEVTRSHYGLDEECEECGLSLIHI